MQSILDGVTIVLCKAVLTLVHSCYLFLCLECLGGLHYDSLYALSLHSTFAHLWVPFSLHVRQNKRMSTCVIKLKLDLHITQTKTYFIKVTILFIHFFLEVYIKHYLSEPCVDCPAICV